MTTLEDSQNAVGRAEVEEVLEMDRTQLDELPFGAIQLDEDGKVLAFNQHEANLTGRKPQDVLGKNFFEEVAPCTNVKEFAGRFKQGVQSGELHAVFPYLFDFKMDPRQVWVTLCYSDATGTAWVFVRDRGSSG